LWITSGRVSGAKEALNLQGSSAPSGQALKTTLSHGLRFAPPVATFLCLFEAARLARKKMKADTENPARTFGETAKPGRRKDPLEEEDVVRL